MYVCRIRRIVSRGAVLMNAKRKTVGKIPICRIVTGWHRMPSSIFCVTISSLFCRLSVTEQVCSFVCLNSLSPYQSYSQSAVCPIFKYSSDVVLQVREVSSVGEGHTRFNFGTTFQTVTCMVYPLLINNRTFYLQGVFVSITNCLTDWPERRRTVFSWR